MPKSESLRCSWLSCYLKSDREGIAQVALNKRATVSDSLLLLFTKEKHWAICSGRSWKKSNSSILLFFASESLFGSQAICSKKFEKIVFFIWFFQFSPFLCQRVNPSCRSQNFVRTPLKPDLIKTPWFESIISLRRQYSLFDNVKF